MAENWFKVGAHVMTHGVNDDHIGRIEEILPGRVLRLSLASWVSESGRLGAFVKAGKADGMEIEYIGNALVCWEAIYEWPHKLFTKTV